MSARPGHLALFCLIASTSSIATEADLRLAGILSLDDGSAIALIESPNGDQKWYRLGESVGDGTLTEITERGVTLEVDAQKVELRLAGSGRRILSPSNDSAPSEPSGTATNPVHPDNLRDVKRLASESEGGKAEELASQTMAYLSLPRYSKITAVNGQPVDNPADALRKMAESIPDDELESPGFKFVVSLSGPRGVSRIYIFSDENSRIYSP